jgi:putative acetyltransferase
LTSLSISEKHAPHSRRGGALSWSKPLSEKLLAALPEPAAGAAFIRGEEQRDEPQIRDLLEASFPGYGEADLVDALRAAGDLVLSLVAEDAGIVIGHIAYSRLSVVGAEGTFPAVALAPLAVYPEYQQQGVATRLVRESHACLAAMGETLSLVLGEPTYYSRFGYSHRRAAHFDSDYQSPYLMALSFGAAPWEGRLVYPTAFAALSGDAPQADNRV